jgi:hypothetical protein
MSDKREYIKPELEIIETDGYEMICTSLTISEEETKDPGRVNERRGDWGDLWK